MHFYSSNKIFQAFAHMWVDKEPAKPTFTHTLHTSAWVICFTFFWEYSASVWLASVIMLCKWPSEHKSLYMCLYICIRVCVRSFIWLEICAQSANISYTFRFFVPFALLYFAFLWSKCKCDPLLTIWILIFCLNIYASMTFKTIAVSS